MKDIPLVPNADATLTGHSDPNISSALRNERGTISGGQTRNESQTHKIVHNGFVVGPKLPPTATGSGRDIN